MTMSDWESVRTITITIDHNATGVTPQSFEMTDHGGRAARFSQFPRTTASYCSEPSIMDEDVQHVM